MTESCTNTAVLHNALTLLFAEQNGLRYHANVIQCRDIRNAPEVQTDGQSSPGTAYSSGWQPNVLEEAIKRA